MTTPELTPAEKVRVARTSVTHEPKIEGCVDCEEKAPIRAVILSPNLGTPLILPPGQTTCSIFIAAEAIAERYFGVMPPKELRPTTYFGNLVRETQYGPVFVDRHLRVYPISAKATHEDTHNGMLFKDGKAASKAMTAVKVWQVGKFRGGIMVNHLGNPTAIIRSSTVAMYVGLTDVYEIEIDLAKLPSRPSPADVHSFAWMVPVPQAYRGHPDLKGVSDWEYQDQIIYDFLRKQQTDPEQHHDGNMHEYDIGAAKANATALPAPRTASSHRLMAWHPMMWGKKDLLRIGHLSDVHVNVRHRALAKSDVAVIEEQARPRTAQPAMANLCDSLTALIDLVEQFKDKADALVITGDLLDFNRNIDPAMVGSTPTSQWPQFNVLNKIRDGKLYKRGLDDMLVYSLLRHAYRDLKLPVFLTTGNHEAYAVPYGVSPRMNDRAIAVTSLEMAGAVKGPHSKREVDYEKLKTAGTVSTVLGGIVGGLPGAASGAGAVKKASDLFEDKDKASGFAETKANDGIAADHNLTIYEICLAYGPTYPQLLTTNNFTAANYDWFFTLFTPLSDWRIQYGTQSLVGLDWGSSENVANVKGLLAYDYPTRSDKQGVGILPRAPQAISNLQCILIDSAQKQKRNTNGSLLLFSHFTIVNYDMKIALSDSDRKLIPAARPTQRTYTQFGNNSGGWNLNNMGTCEQGLMWYFDNCLNTADGADYHFSGHSHRQGIYTTKKHGDEMHIVSAFDPGLQQQAVNNTKLQRHTRFIVSSCGGPVGVQNLEHELGGWTLTPPSGTLLDPQADKPFRQIFTHKGNGQPRLAVALDYLHIAKVETPIRWSHIKANRFHLIVGPKTQKLECLAGIKIWGFLNAKKHWLSFDTTLKFIGLARGSAYESPSASPHSGVYEMTISAEKTADIRALQDPLLAKVTRWFCEVSLKAPKGFDANHFKLDAWLFPIEFQVRQTQYGQMTEMYRRVGEQGEVPDWDWLADVFDRTRYLRRRTAIRCES